MNCGDLAQELSEENNISMWPRNRSCGILVFQARIPLCSLSCPGPRSVDQADLNSQKSICLCLPTVGTKGGHHHRHCLAVICIFDDGHSDENEMGS